MLILRAAAPGACRDCAQPGLGGPAENRFTAYDSVCKGLLCRDQGYPQVYVNASNLTLFVRVTDLVFGGPAPALTLERSFNQDDTRPGAFGIGWSFSLGDTLTPDTDGSVLLRRGSGRVDRFAAAAGATSFFAITNTRDTLTQAGDGSYTLRGAAGVTYLFRADGKLAAIQDGKVTRVALEYDTAGRLATARYRGRAIQFTADSQGRVAKVADAIGRTVSFSYSSDGRLTKQTNADGGSVTYEYDGAGNLTSVGGRFQIAYTGEPPYLSVASVTTPDGAVRQYDIPRTPTEIRVTDGNGDATLFVSSVLGLLQSVTDAAGNLTSYTYDVNGNRTSAVNPAGETATFTYDAGGNLTGIVDAANNRWAADYSSGFLTRLTDPKRNVWGFKYDDAGNLVSVTDPAAGAASAQRTASGQIASLADANGNKSSYRYGADGLLTEFTDALGGKWTYEYDGAARASARTDPGGTTLRAAYTASNRIMSLNVGDATASFVYPGLISAVISRTTNYTDSFGNQIVYRYDAAGQLTALTLPGDKTVTYQYDHLRRLSAVTDWAGNMALYRYDVAGYPLSVSVSAGPVTIYQYDAARNLRAIVSTGPDGTPVAAYRYSVDANGNRTGVSAMEPNPSGGTLPAYTFGYDAANRPATRSDGQSYGYDVRGNLSAISGSRNAKLGYDAIGRLSTMAAETTAFYGYDAMGLRVSRSDRRFVWDPTGTKPRVVMETDASNVPIAWYVYGLGLLWKVTADGTPYFYHFDGDGNVVAISNATAGVVNRYRCDAAGRLVASDEAIENMFRARGEAGWIDDGNGLIFTGSEFQFPELRLALPATADPAPPSPDLRPPLKGAGACFFEGVANCSIASARRER